MSAELVQWLQGALDEDEQAARDAVGGWIPLGPAETDPRPVAGHMRRHDPASVLADIAAKRAILDRYDDACQLERTKPGYDAVARLNVSLAKVLAPELERIVRLLASAYAHRPGYRQEWAP